MADNVGKIPGYQEKDDDLGNEEPGNDVDEIYEVERVVGMCQTKVGIAICGIILINSISPRTAVCVVIRNVVLPIEVPPPGSGCTAALSEMFTDSTMLTVIRMQLFKNNTQ